MSRPTTKVDLLAASNEHYQKLKQVMQALPDDKQTFNFDVTEKMKEVHWQRDKNLRDVLIHLYEWHQLLLNWVKANQNGDPQPFLPAPYNWKSYGQMNQEFWQKHQTTSLAEAKKCFQKSHEDVMTLLATFSNDELFTKKYFAWTGTTSLGSYFISTTSSHYDWAIKKIEKADKSKQRS